MLYYIYYIILYIYIYIYHVYIIIPYSAPLLQTIPYLFFLFDLPTKRLSYLHHGGRRQRRDGKQTARWRCTEIARNNEYFPTVNVDVSKPILLYLGG